MKAKFYYVSGSVNEFRTLKQAREFATTHEIYEVGITKNNVYLPLYRYNPMSEKYQRIYKVCEAKKSIDFWLKSEVVHPEDYMI